jgi:hypothetical protein
MTGIPYNYGKYIDDKVSMTNQGHVSASKQIQSPASAGSRGLAKTTQFTKDKTQMKMGNTPISESMVEIRSILNRIDGVNAPVQEETVNDGKILSMISDLRDAIMEHPEMSDDAKTAVYTSLEEIEQAIQMIHDDYEPFPEADEFDIEEDEDFEEVLGPLGFPEDETELFDAEYRGRKVPLNKPMRGDVKKFKVYVKDPKSGNVKKVNFGHGGTSAKRKTMRIRKSNPKARKSFRARHNCANPGPKTKARYWSCRKW